MTLVKTLATHQIVDSVFPRPTTERGDLAKAVGKAVDDTLSRFSHEFSQSRRPTVASMDRLAASVLDEELADLDVELAPGDREKVLAQIAGLLRAFRGTEAFGLSRPRTRLILVNEKVGVYAQPDFWNGRDRFYEMKSFKAVPPPPDVQLQLAFFQLAFPGFSAFLLSFDRQRIPIGSILTAIPRISEVQANEVLRLAYRTGSDSGEDKVLEYIDSPIVRYSVEA